MHEPKIPIGDYPRRLVRFVQDFSTKLPLRAGIDTTNRDIRRLLMLNCNREATGCPLQGGGIISMALLIAKNSREAIPDAFSLLFYRSGIGATTVLGIAREAGLTEGEFYLDFASKDDIVAAFLRRRYEIWFAWFKAEVESRLDNASYGLEVIADVLQIWFEDPSFRGCAFINTFAEAAGVSAEALSISREAKEELRHYLTDVARRLHLKEPQTAAAAAVMVVEGAIVRAQMTRDSNEVYNARLLFRCLNHA